MAGADRMTIEEVVKQVLLDSYPALFLVELRSGLAATEPNV